MGAEWARERMRELTVLTKVANDYDKVKDTR